MLYHIRIRSDSDERKVWVRARTLEQAEHKVKAQFTGYEVIASSKEWSKV